MLEIPRNLLGWVYKPASVDTPRGEVQNLVRWSRPMLDQEWEKYHIKDTGMGAMVWETRSAPFWMPREGEVVGPYWLVAARDVRDRSTIKYFLCNAEAGVPLEVILHVGFSRWPVERCLEDEKSELGLSHFEVRKYPAVLRHLRLTQVSHLFLARQTQRLREKKSAGDDLPGSRCGPGAAGRAAAECGGSKAAAVQSGADHPGNTTEECRLTRLARQVASSGTGGPGHPCEGAALLHSAVTG